MIHCLKFFTDTGGFVNGTTDINDITWGRSYECNLNRSYNLTSKDAENGRAEVMFPYLRVQVFHFDKEQNFSEGMCGQLKWKCALNSILCSTRVSNNSSANFHR